MIASHTAFPRLRHALIGMSLVLACSSAPVVLAQVYEEEYLTPPAQHAPALPHAISLPPLSPIEDAPQEPPAQAPGISIQHSNSLQQQASSESLSEEAGNAPTVPASVSTQQETINPPSEPSQAKSANTLNTQLPKTQFKKQSRKALFTSGHDKRQMLSEEILRLKEERQENGHKIQQAQTSLNTVRTDLSQLESRWQVVHQQLIDLSNSLLPPDQQRHTPERSAKQ